MFDFYAVSSALVAIAGLFGFINWKTKRDVEGVKTPIKMIPPVKEVEVPVEESDTPHKFEMVPIDSVITPRNERKRNVGGRSTIPDSELRKFDSMEDVKITFEWEHNVKVIGPGSFVVNGGGTPTSKFFDFKLTRNIPVHEAMAIGVATCTVLSDGEVIAIGTGKVKLGIMPSGDILL